MPRAKSVKPEAAPKPEADLQQITVDKGEFTRTRDAVRFFPFNVASPSCCAHLRDSIYTKIELVACWAQLCHVATDASSANLERVTPTNFTTRH